MDSGPYTSQYGQEGFAFYDKIQSFHEKEKINILVFYGQKNQKTKPNSSIFSSCWFDVI